MTISRSFLPRRMASAAALCVAAYSSIGQLPARQDAPFAPTDGCTSMVSHAAPAVRKHPRSRNRQVYSWHLPRNRLQQEYILESVIGEGGYGRVHMGLHRDSNTRVAIKRVSKQLTTKANFLQEVAILEQVGGTHNVVALREAFETSDAYVLVTELVHGKELYDELIHHGVYEEARAKALVADLAATLQYLHALQVVHADLKPENILVFQEPATRLRLIDFGQSFRLYEATERGLNICTTAYASPEVLSYRKPGCAMDVWALGIVLYVILCGTHPFDPTNEATDFELQERIRKGTFDCQSPRWKCLSPLARDLIQRMLTVDPVQRISASQVLQHEWLTSL